MSRNFEIRCFSLASTYQELFDPNLLHKYLTIVLASLLALGPKPLFEELQKWNSWTGYSLSFGANIFKQLLCMHIFIKHFLRQENLIFI